ncbi:unnamed protein product [Rhizophagus irregularis]|nr:unnamed protein product [Rhizophagus irregularis]
MPRYTRSRHSHYNIHWNWAMMDELVDIHRDRNHAYHNINGRSRHDFWDSVANSAAKSGGTSSGITITISFIVIVTLGGGCGRVPAKDIIANLEQDFGRGRSCVTIVGQGETYLRIVKEDNYFYFFIIY